jgi:hypothetical protein
MKNEDRGKSKQDNKLFKERRVNTKPGKKMSKLSKTEKTLRRQTRELLDLLAKRLNSVNSKEDLTKPGIWLDHTILTMRLSKRIQIPMSKSHKTTIKSYQMEAWINSLKIITIFNMNMTWPLRMLKKSEKSRE